MKKAIIAVLAIAIIAVGGWFVYDRVIMSPERQIVGAWQNESHPNFYYKFNDDGTMQGKVEILGMETAIDGTYTLDRETEVLSISYKIESSLLSISTTYDVDKTFEIDGDKLTLTEDGTATAFARVDPDAVKTTVAEEE